MIDRRPLRVVVVEDDPIMLDGLANIIDAESDLSVVGRARDGVEAVDQATRHRPDVVVMDVQMPNLDGIAATARIKSAANTPRVLVLTVFGDDRSVLQAFRAGADGFVLKRIEAHDLHAAIRRVAAGDALVDPSVTRRLINTHLLEQPYDSTLLESHRLTARETEVLRQLAHGLSNAQIASNLKISEHTVKTHVSSVLAKTASESRVQAVIFAYNAGLVRRAPSDR